MKNLFRLMFLMFICSALSCSKKANPNDGIATAYIVSDTTVVIASIKIKSANIPVHPGTSYNFSVVEYVKLEKNFVNQAFSSGITKPGLDFSLISGCWARGYEQIHKSNVMKNAIYIEKGGIIKSVRNLYINYRGITKYRMVRDTLYIKKLTPVEVDDLPKDIKSRVSKENFVY